MTPGGRPTGPRSVPGSGSGPWAANVKVPQPRSALVDPVSGGPTREWSWYWQALWERTGQGNSAAPYLPISGGQMTGELVLAGPPANANDAATKAYVDAHSGGIPDAPSNSQTYGRYNGNWITVVSTQYGGIVQGPLQLMTAPILNTDVATKGYVDSAIAGGGGWVDAPSNSTYFGRYNGTWANVLGLAGGTMTGIISFAPNQGLIFQPNNGIIHGISPNLTFRRPVAPGDVGVENPDGSGWSPIITQATGDVRYALAGAPAGIPEAPDAANTYGRQGPSASTWVAVLPLAGGTLTGPLTLSGPGASANQPVTVSQFNGTVTQMLPLAGGTLTGPLVLAGNATANLNPVTLQQLNAAIAGVPSNYLPLSGGNLTGSIQWAAVNQGLTFLGGATAGAALYMPTATQFNLRRPLNGDCYVEDTSGANASPIVTQATMGTALGGYLPLSGGALTGALSVNTGINYTRLGSLGTGFEFAWTGTQMFAYVNGIARGPFTFNGLPLAGGQMTGTIVAIAGSSSAAGVAFGDQSTGWYRQGTGTSTQLVATAASVPVAAFMPSGLWLASGCPLDSGANTLNNVATPTLANQAATKGYVDSAIGGVLSQVTTDASLTGSGTAASPLSIAVVDGLRTS